MGTEYKLYEDEEFGELTIGEMSNRLSLNFFDKYDSEFIYSSKDMSPEEMAKVFLEGLKVCSYWMDADELKALIKNHVDKEIY